MAIDPSKLDNNKPFKVVQIPEPLAALSAGGASTRIICECKTLEEAVEARHFEDVDELAPYKHDFRRLRIVYFVGWLSGKNRVYD